MDIQWQCKPFNELSPHELYKILQLRNAVFVVEQNCVFQDADDKDDGCLHFMGFSGRELAAYTRLAPPGYIYERGFYWKGCNVIQDTEARVWEEN
jgi:ElaA protein